MITTMIVDDEVWVCQLIKRIVKWEELDFNIIGEVYDGNEAFEQIKEKKPDLVITDIRMPGLDGISLIKKVKESGLETKFIIVSGYNDFEYAKDAIKYGALGYLLKPIDKKELTDFLVSVRSSVFSQREKVLEEELVKEELAHSLGQLKEQFFLKLLLLDTVKAEKINIDNINLEYKSNFKQGSFQVVSIKTDFKSGEQVNESVVMEILDHVRQVIATELGHICFDMVTTNYKSQVLCILNYDTANDYAIRSWINTFFDKIAGNASGVNDYDLTAGIGSVETEISLLPRSYRLAQDAIKARIILGTGKVIDVSKSNYSSVELKELFPIDKEKKLSYFFEVFDYKAAETLIAEVLHNFTRRSEINPGLIFELSYEILEVFYKVMRRMDIGIDKEFVGKSTAYTEIGECKSVKQIVDCFSKLFEGALNLYNNMKQSQNRKAIEMVKAYICDHYAEDIGLNDVAGLVFLNPKYLGELFKKEAGINFSDYVINYRLDAAKELLKDIRYRTNEVAEMVGYKDAKHFSKLFKKIVGVTPAEYKKMFG